MKSQSINVQFKKIEDHIKDILESAGAKDVRYSSNYGGAYFSYRLDDIVDEREFKKRVENQLRKEGYRI